MTDIDLLEGMVRPDVYDPGDRHRDFQAVFMATEQGQQVLREILTWGHINSSCLSAPGEISQHRLAAQEGARLLALSIWKTVKYPPSASRPTRQTSKREDHG